MTKVALQRQGEKEDSQRAIDTEMKREKERVRRRKKLEGKVPFDYYQHCRHLHMHSSAT